MLWFITMQNVWVSVFATGTCLGLYLLENLKLQEESRDLRENVSELEKQVVGLRTTIDRLIRLN
jgi:hypothetical protein